MVVEVRSLPRVKQIEAALWLGLFPDRESQAVVRELLERGNGTKTAICRRMAKVLVKREDEPRQRATERDMQVVPIR